MFSSQLSFSIICTKISSPWHFLCWDAECSDRVKHSSYRCWWNQCYPWRDTIHVHQNFWFNNSTTKPCLHHTISPKAAFINWVGVKVHILLNAHISITWSMQLSWKWIEAMNTKIEDIYVTIKISDRVFFKKNKLLWSKLLLVLVVAKQSRNGTEKRKQYESNHWENHKIPGKISEISSNQELKAGAKMAPWSGTHKKSDFPGDASNSVVYRGRNVFCGELPLLLLCWHTYFRKVKYNSFLEKYPITFPRELMALVQYFQEFGSSYGWIVIIYSLLFSPRPARALSLSGWELYFNHLSISQA